MAKSNTRENHQGGLGIMTCLRLNLAFNMLQTCSLQALKSTWKWRNKISATRSNCHGKATVYWFGTVVNVCDFPLQHHASRGSEAAQTILLFSRENNDSLDSESMWQRISAVSFKSKTWWNVWSSGTVCQSYKGFIVLASIATADGVFNSALPASDWCAQPTSRSAGQWQRLLDVKLTL